MSDTEKNTFETWAVLELMGHVKWAGKVSEQVIFGTPMVRVDVPETKRQPAFTKFYGASSIYCITPTTEAIARTVAETLYSVPVQHYAPVSRQLNTADYEQDDDTEY